MLEASDLSYLQGGRSTVEGVSLNLAGGQLVALLGPNGAGKTTLLRLLSGELNPSKGEVRLRQRPLKQYTPQQLALERAFLPQQRDLGFPFTAYEVVMLGRLPHQQQRPENQEDRDAVNQTLGALEATSLAHRLYTALSGGEKARIDLARVLAQQAPILLLDEPTNHLDPRHQLILLNHCRQLVARGGLVIAALHDLNLAAHYADQVVLLREGHLIRYSDPGRCLTPQVLEEVYQIPFQVVSTARGKPWILPSLVD
jgi:iron complex transport system ATP-binding protein